MIKGITKNIHGFADYSYVPLVLAAPRLAAFEHNKKATAIVRAFALADLGYTLLTDAKWGVAKLIPYKTHAMLDFSIGVLALAAPTIFNIRDKKAKSILLLMGFTGLVVGSLSIIGSSKKNKVNR